MLRFFFDQDFNHNILRGLILRIPDLDHVTAVNAGIARASDSEVLDWATAEQRTVVTHDVNTMPACAYERIREGQPTSGVLVVPQNLTIAVAITELEMIATCSFEGEWDNLIIYVPL